MKEQDIIKSIFTFFKLRWVWAIPVILLCVTIVLSYTADRLNNQKLADLFEVRQNQFITDLQHQLFGYNQLLRGGVALFSASDEVTREEWHSYVGKLKIDKDYPEIIEFSYAEIVDSENGKIKDFLSEQDDLNFKNKFAEEKNFFVFTKYAEPKNQINQNAFGYNLWKNEVIKDAMRMASLKQETVISDEIDSIYNENLDDDNSYALMLFPEYATHGNVEEGILDIMDLRGFIYVILKLDDVLENTLAEKDYGLCANFSDAFTTSEKNLLANHKCLDEKSKISKALTSTKGISILNSNWLIEFVAAPNFGSNINTNLPLFVFLFGLILSFFCFFALWGLDNAKTHAEEVALEKVKLLKESEKQLSAAIEGGALGLWDWEFNTGKVIYSKGWASMIGYDLKELQPKLSTWENLLHPNDYETAKKDVFDYIEGRTKVFQTEFRMRHKKSGWVWILSRGKITERDENGNPLRLLGTHTDISKLKNAEKKFIESQKMEAIGQLSGGIAHDFNNLLTITFGNITLLERLLNKPDVDVQLCKKKINIIKQTAERGANLVKRLMVFSRQKDLDMQKTDINELIENLEPLLKRSITEIVELKLSLSKKAWPALIDPGQFEQALINLCINARDAMPEGGTLSIETKNISLGSEDVLNAAGLKEGEFITISISDTGNGIDKTIQEKIFDPFFTTKDIGKGTGLGLSMVYGLIQDAGGSISVYSEKDVGTTFRIYLPRSHEVAANDSIAKDQSQSEDIYAGTETILIVEDEPEIRELVRQNLISYGYTVLSASNGHEALEIVKNEKTEIDLLFSDIAMPGQMSGIKLAEETLKIRPMRVLLTTGFTKENIPNRNLYKDQYFFISKPYNNDELMQKIRYILDGSGLNRNSGHHKTAS